MSRLRIALVAATSWGSRIVTSGIALISTPILVSSLGESGYAAWAVLGGLAPWLSLFQFGIGTSLQNSVARRRALDLPTAAIIRKGLLIILVPMALAALVIYVPRTYWAHLLLSKFTDFPAEILTLAFVVAAFGLVGQVTYCVMGGIWFAEDRGYIANALPAFSSAIGLLTFISFRSFVPDTLLLPFAAGSFYIPVAALASVAYVGRLLRSLQSASTDPEPASTDAYDKLVVQGSRHWVMALLANGVLSVDYLVISQTLDAAGIATYAITTKIFSIAFFVFNAVLLASGPMLTRAAAHRNWKPANQLLVVSMSIGAAVVVCAGVVLAIAGDFVFGILAPDTEARPSLAFLGMLVFYNILRIWTDSCSAVLTCQNILTPFYRIVPIQLVLGLVLQIVLSMAFGVTGVVVALIVSYGLTVSWYLPIQAIKSQRSAEAEASALS